MDFASSPRRLQRQVHYSKLRFGFGVRSRSRGILTLRYRVPPIELRSNLHLLTRHEVVSNILQAARWKKRGGGEIRTHEAFRPSGFQDRRIQPLCHPSPKISVARIVPSLQGWARVDRAVPCSMLRVAAEPQKFGIVRWSGRSTKRTRQVDMFM